MRAGRVGAAAEVVHVCMDAGRRRFVPPGVDQSSSVVLIPGRRLLPLDLGGEAGSVPAGEGVGLEPRDVDDGPMRVERLELTQSPLRAEVRGPRLQVA